MLMQTPPESDFKFIFDAAVSFSKGDYSFDQTPYFTDWAYQTGFMVYEGTVVKLFGIENAQFVLKILNALFNSGICLLVYSISRNFVRESVARFGSLLSAGALFPIAFVSVLTNQHISAFFLILGLFIIIDKKFLKLGGLMRGVLSGLSLALGNIMRPEGIIIILALLLVFLMRLIRPQAEDRKGMIVKALALLVIYAGTNILASQLIISEGINKEGLRNNNPLWKVVTGLNFESRGSMTQEDSDLIYGDHAYTPEERNAIELSLIKERLMDLKALLPLFIAKQQSLWGGDPLVWCYGQLTAAKTPVKILTYPVPIEYIAGLLRGLHELQIFVLVVLSIMGGVYLLRNSESKDVMIFYIILIISAAAYLIIEVQPRYVYLPQAILFITTAFGVEGLNMQILAKLKNIKQY